MYGYTYINFVAMHCSKTLRRKKKRKRSECLLFSMQGFSDTEEKERLLRPWSLVLFRRDERKGNFVSYLAYLLTCLPAWKLFFEACLSSFSS